MKFIFLVFISSLLFCSCKFLGEDEEKPISDNISGQKKGMTCEQIEGFIDLSYVNELGLTPECNENISTFESNGHELEDLFNGECRSESFSLQVTDILYKLDAISVDMEDDKISGGEYKLSYGVTVGTVTGLNKLQLIDCTIEYTVDPDSELPNTETISEFVCNFADFSTQYVIEKIDSDFNDFVAGNTNCESGSLSDMSTTEQAKLATELIISYMNDILVLE